MPYELRPHPSGDGGGSGKEKEIIVNQSNVGTTLGGTIDSSSVYFIDGSIDMGTTSIEVPATGITFKGHSFDVSSLTSTEDNYSLFTSPVGGSGNILGEDCALTTSGTNSQIYNIVDSSGFHAIELIRINFINCTSLGTIDNYRQGLETGTGRFGGSPSLTLAGVWVGGYRITTSIVRNLSAGMTGALFEAGTGFVMSSRFLTDINCDLPTSAALLDFTPANFASSSLLQIGGAIITRGGVADASDSNLTPNIDQTALASTWGNNIGLNNTFEGGRAELTTEITTPLSGGVFSTVSGNWTISSLEHFDNPAAGQLRHLGTSPREYSVVVDAIIEGNSNRELILRIKKWDDSASAFVTVADQARPVNSLQGGRDVAFFTITTEVGIDQNDYIFLEVANTTDNSNVTMELSSFMRIIKR